MKAQGVLPTENILSDALTAKKTNKKIRNYSFQKSRRLPPEKMTNIGGIKIPSMPGSCYHAIMATLVVNKDKFCSWQKIIDGTHHHMRMYGGEQAWQKFIDKGNVKSYEQRIKDNAHTLTRSGKDCYGFRLHEQGMCIYYFKDGALLITGGELTLSGEDKYDVIFASGHRLQTRYRGTTMTYREYLKFLECKLINKSGKILNVAGLKRFRDQSNSKEGISEVSSSESHVCVILDDGFDQYTANRLEGLGLQVEQALGNELIGSIRTSCLEVLRTDKDVKEVEVSGD